MSPPKVYVETSVISYLTGRPSSDPIVKGRQAVTRQWWESHRPNYALFISELVVQEASSGDPAAVKHRLAVLEHLPLVALNDTCRELARRLLETGVVPANAAEDALHIAAASVHGFDFLLTWNFRHINNAHRKQGINQVIDDLGLIPAVLCSPEELVEEST